MTIAAPLEAPHASEYGIAVPPSPVRLVGLGVALPSLCCAQQEIQETMAAIWGLQGNSLERWKRIIAGSEIESRCAVLRPEDVVGLSTQQRMLEYERHAPGLAAAAARNALAHAGTPAQAITDLIVVSCTGFSAPGVDVALVHELGLRRSIRRTIVGFMGCFGAIVGVRSALGACAANPGAVALVVCVELCSLHMRAEPDIENQIASALFADGAAAAIVRSCARGSESPFHASAIGRVESGSSMLLERGKDWMTWRITDSGFAMTLTRDVPVALQQCLVQFVRDSGSSPPRTFIIHPGGPGILDAADVALRLDGGKGLQASRSVLRRIGNVSSGTVFFALQEALSQGCPLPAMLIAFGPGLTIESVVLSPEDR